MANIPRLSPGLALIANVKRPGARPYGSYCSATVVPGDFAVIADNSGTKLAIIQASAPVSVELAQLNPVVLPYVNRFLTGTGVAVIKDWRTGKYRLKTVKAAKVRQNASAVSRSVVATVEVQPSADIIANVAAEIASQPKAATITIAPRSEPSAPVVATVTDPIPGMVYPKGIAPKLKGAGRGWTNVDGVVVPTTGLETLNTALALRKKGKLGSVLITGPAGTAKTTLVGSFAATVGLPMLTVDCSEVRTTDDWSSKLWQDPNTKTWSYRWTPFARALRAGQPCIILLDELTRTESPAALNSLLGLLGPTGRLLVSGSDVVLTIPDGVLVVATANIGPEFVGTLPLDGAVRQRFRFGIRMGMPTEALEAKLLVDVAGIDRAVADSLVRMAVQQRLHRNDPEQYPSGGLISPRVLIGIAETMAEGHMTDRDAVWSVLTAQFDPEDEKALSIIVDANFPKKPEPTAPVEPTPATITMADGSQYATTPSDRHWFSDGGVGSTTCWRKNPTVCGLPEANPIHFGGINP